MMAPSCSGEIQLVKSLAKAGATIQRCSKNSSEKTSL